MASIVVFSNSVFAVMVYLSDSSITVTFGCIVLGFALISFEIIVNMLRESNK